MKVLHDYQIFIRQQYGGISRYHYELVEKMNKVDGVEAEIAVLFPRCTYLKSAKRRVYSYKSSVLRNAVMFLNEIYSLLKILCASFSEPYGIVHITWYKPFYFSLIKTILGKKAPKMVLTVHDLVHEMEAENNPVLARGAEDRKKMLEIADHIIAISDNTKKDLLHFYPALDKKSIKVIYHGYMSSDLSADCQMSLRKNSVFFVGQRKNYKNFINFLEGMGILKKMLPDIQIVCAGGGCFSIEEQECIDRLGLHEVIGQKFMTDEELAATYSHAGCFVFPSLYEGFGMPILEAFSYGCPVALSNASCFPEIGMGAAKYFDGKDPQNIANVVYEILTSDEIRNDLIQAGFKRLKDFSWVKAANETLSVYEREGEH